MKMTINEAIKHYEELAEVNEDIANNCDMDNWMNKAGCEERASDYRQLAGWLKELIEARHYLVEAVDGFKALGKELDEKCELNLDCSKCPLNNGGNCRKWKYTDKVKALL